MPQGPQMTEPVSTTAAAVGSAVGWAKVGSIAKSVFTSPYTLAAMAATIVMMMTMPAGKKQQFVALLSTFLGSIFGGSFIIEHYALASLSSIALGGVYLLAGLPIWVAVRGFFAYTERDKTKSIIDYIKEIRSAWKD